MIEQHELYSNGQFALLRNPYDKKQHQNQQAGLDSYVDVVNFNTGRVCTLKLYLNTQGIHFKMDGTHYLSGFTEKVIYVPFQIIQKN